MPSTTAARVLQPLTPSANANPLDVLKIKSVLGALGHYKAPDWGISPFPDPALFKAIQAFQRKCGLKVDGVMKPGGPTEASLRAALTPQQTGAAMYATAQTIQAMGQGGDTLLAHITPEEAQLLDALTDGASINPATGLLEFRWGGSGSYRGHVKTDTQRDDTSPDRVSYDASADQKENQAAANTLLGGNSKGDGSDTRATGGQDTLGSGNSLTAPDTAKPAPSTKADQDESRARLARTVLVPDNDPSFTSSFFEKKAPVQPGGKTSRLLSKSTKEKAPNVAGAAMSSSNNATGISSGPATRGGTRGQPSLSSGFDSGPLTRPSSHPVQSNDFLSEAINAVEKGYINATSWHFEDRDLLNSPLPENEKQAISMGFERYPADQSIFHQNNIGKKEKKYGHPDGREVVFDGDTGKIVTNDQYRGTYNYEVPSPVPKSLSDMKAWQDYVQNGGEYFVKDIAPYLIGGNVRGRY